MKRSTKTTKRSDAQKIAEKYEEAARKKRTLKQVRSVLQELHERVNGEGVETLTVRSHIENWLAEKKGETAPATMQFYKGSTTKFIAFLSERADQDINEITRKDVTS